MYNILHQRQTLAEYIQKQSILHLLERRGCEQALLQEKRYKLICLSCDTETDDHNVLSSWQDLSYRDIHDDDYFKSNRKGNIYRHLTTNKTHLRNVRKVNGIIKYLPIDIENKAEIA